MWQPARYLFTASELPGSLHGSFESLKLHLQFLRLERCVGGQGPGAREAPAHRVFISLQLGVYSREELAGGRMGTLDSSLVPPEAGLLQMASLCVWSEFQKCQAHPYIQGKDGAVKVCSETRGGGVGWWEVSVQGVKGPETPPCR